VSLMNSVAKSKGKSVWIEKTPDHLFHINEIQVCCANAKYIHIIRNGLDNIASLYDVVSKYPVEWDADWWTLDRCVGHWIKAVSESLRYASDSDRHIIVEYEKLVAEPEGTIKLLCQFLEIPFYEVMIASKSRERASKNLVRNEESWKSSVDKPIERSPSKFNEVFSVPERTFIIDTIEHAGLSRFIGS
jgi:hypothetical protein